MKISRLTREPALHVLNNLRDVDREEIYALRFDEDPGRVADELMLMDAFAWVMWHGDRPAIVLGAHEMWPGVWTVFCFGTDDFDALALPLTRFVKETMIPILFDDLGAHRLEADSLATHENAHRWMGLCGARKEAVKQKRGKGGEDFFTFVIVKGVDT